MTTAAAPASDSMPMAPSKVSADLAPMMELDRGRFKLTKYFEFSETGFTTLAKPPMDVCENLCEFLKIVHAGTQWMIGDFVNMAEATFGEEASQLVDVEHLPEASIKVYRWASARVALSNRRRELSFEHHVAVAALEPSQQIVWLQKAIDGDDGAKWSSARLKREIKNAEAGGPPLGAASAEYTVTITCDGEADQDALCRQLDNLGRTGKYHAKKPRS